MGSATVGLLSASDPNALLQGGDYRNYVSSRHLDVMSSLDRATVAKSNADAKAKALVALQRRAGRRGRRRPAGRPAGLRQPAGPGRPAAGQRGQLPASTGRGPDPARHPQRPARRVRRLPAGAGPDRGRARPAGGAGAGRGRGRPPPGPAPSRNASASTAAATAAVQQQQQWQQRLGSAARNSGGDTPPPPSGGSGGWTAGKGQAAANRALSRLGTPYAWAGGGYDGPDLGRRLARHRRRARQPGVRLRLLGADHVRLGARRASTSTTTRPRSTTRARCTRRPGNFLPGDLLFWSDGGIGAIHHVALYIGGGNVVQAPHSGDVVKVTPWDQVSYGYLGATRPLT